MKCNAKIVIRSYDRPWDSRLKTIGQLLNQTDIDLGKCLYVVVADDDQRKLYEEALRDVPLAGFLISGLGAATAANYICRHFPEGDRLIFMDDDLENIRTHTVLDGKGSGVKTTNLGAMFDYIFDQMEEGGTFGVNYTSNVFYKKGKPHFEFRLGHVGGAWWGGYNQRSYQTDPRYRHGHDNVRTAQILHEGKGAYFLHSLTAVTHYGKNPGGMQTSGDRAESHLKAEQTRRAVDEMWETHPLVSIYFRERYFHEASGGWTNRLDTIRGIERKLSQEFPRVKWSEFGQSGPDLIK